MQGVDLIGQGFSIDKHYTRQQQSNSGFSKELLWFIHRQADCAAMTVCPYNTDSQVTGEYLLLVCLGAILGFIACMVST